MAEVRLTAAAWDDLAHIADYHLRMAGADSARRITDKLLDALELLTAHPLAGPVHPDPVLARYGYRKLVVDSHVAVYRPVDEIIFIYGIFHGARNYPELFRQD